MRSVWCNVYQRFLAGSRSCGWAGFWAGGAAAHVVAHVLHVEHERPARRLRRQQLLVQAAVRRVTCGAMGGRGSSGLDRGSSGRGCGARYRRRAAPPPRTAARGTASALRPSPAVAALVRLVARRARMLERAWRGSMEWGRVPPPRAARRTRAATRPCCACGARETMVPACTRFICDTRT